MLMLLVSGCETVKANSTSAAKAGLTPLADAHADALVEDGGPKSLVTGAALIAAIDSLD